MESRSSDNRFAQREFEALIRPHLAALYRSARNFTGHAEDAEDLVQNVLARLYPRLDELRTIERLRPWLMKVLYREFVDSTRMATRMRQWIKPLDDFDDDDARMAGMASSTHSPEARMEQRDQRQRIADALALLNHDQRALIALHDMEGYSLDEIAEMLDLRRGTIKSRLHRGRARLRSALSMEPFFVAGRVGVQEVAKS